jgi:hypothetical protein
MSREQRRRQLGVQMRRSSAVLSLLLLALLAAACKRRALGGEDGGGGLGGAGGGLVVHDGGGGKGGVGGDLALPDGAAGMGGQDAHVDTGGDVPATGMDARDAPVEVEPPPGLIPCGGSSCDPAREFCKHDVSGLTAGQRVCWPLPAGCAPGGTACGCLLNDAGSWFFCHACRVVSGVDVMGLELDCPGAVG